MSEEKPSWDEERRGSWQFERGRQAGRQEILEVLTKIVADLHENAIALGKYPGAKIEARCREWGALIVEDALQCAQTADRMRDHNARMDRLERLLEEFEQLREEAEEDG